MLRFMKVGLIVVLVAGLGAVVVSKLTAVDEANAPESTATAETSGVPKLLDLGSESCIPCQMMAPVLDELTREYAGQFDVEFIDVGLRENEEVARRYGIRVIPTQIFFDKDGNELWRHEGFLGKAEILAKWQELGVVFEADRPGDSASPAETADVPLSGSQ